MDSSMSSPSARPQPAEPAGPEDPSAGRAGPAAPWQRRVVDRSLGSATQRSIDRSAELIFAAATLLEQRGGDSFTVQEVANAAKQSVRNLYLHFEGKDDLLLAVFEEATRAFARLVLEVIDEYETPLERLTAAVYFAARFSERATHGVTVGMARLRTKLMEVAPDQLAAAQEPMTALFGHLLREAADSGEIDVQDPNGTASMVLTLIYARGQSHALAKEHRLDPPSVTSLVEFTIHGVTGKLPEHWEARFAERWAGMPPRYSIAEHLRVTERSHR